MGAAHFPLPDFCRMPKDMNQGMFVLAPQKAPSHSVVRDEKALKPKLGVWVKRGAVLLGCPSQEKSL